MKKNKIILLSIFMLMFPLKSYAEIYRINANPNQYIKSSQFFNFEKISFSGNSDSPFNLSFNSYFIHSINNVDQNNSFNTLSTQNEYRDYRWLASMLIPGLGQILMGEYSRGLIYTLTYIAIPIIFNQLFIYSDSSIHNPYNIIFINTICAFILTMSVVDAFDLSTAYSERKNKYSVQSLNLDFKFIKF